MKIKYLIPNLVTSVSLISGLIALNLIMDKTYHSASWFIVLAIIIDGLDGKLARTLKASSEFGALFDTLSDFFVFGIIPAFMIYRAFLYTVNPYGLVAALFYVFCGAYRLIRYTIQKHNTNPTNVFLGLPIPAAAGMIIVMILVNHNFGILFNYPFLVVVLTFTASLLMISSIHYTAFETGNFSRLFIIALIILVIISIVAILKYPVYIITLWIVIYVVIGLVRHFIKLVFNK